KRRRAAESRVPERQHDRPLRVFSLFRTGARSPAEKVAEQVADVAAFEVEPLEGAAVGAAEAPRGGAGGGGVETHRASGVPEPVVRPPLLGVSQNVVGLLHVLELLLRR